MKSFILTKEMEAFDELMALRMVDIQALAIIKVKPYVISLGVSLAYDENTHLTSTIDAVGGSSSSNRAFRETMKRLETLSS